MFRIISALAVTCVAFGQAPSVIEVVSLTRGDPGLAVGTGQAGCRRINPGLFRCSQVNLSTMLRVAYGVEGYQIKGPPWLDGELYSLTAKVSKEATQSQISTDLKAVLADRFSIAIHIETERRKAYAMTVAVGGPKLKEVHPTKVAAATAATGSGTAEPPVAGPLRPGAMPPPGLIVIDFGIDGSRTIRGWRTIPQLVQAAVNVLRAPVVDQTGLKGTYEINLTYGGDEHDPSQSPAPTDAREPLPSFVQAMKSSLGLQLRPETLSIEVLVVDRANRIPTEN